MWHQPAAGPFRRCVISETGKAARLQAGGHQWLGDCSCLQLPVLGHPPAPLGSVELSGGHCLVTESESSDQNGRTSFFFFFFQLQYFWRKQWHPTPVLLPGKSHGWRSPVGCSPWGREESDTTERFHFHFSLSCIGEGNGNPLQCSCLENPRDGGA